MLVKCSELSETIVTYLPAAGFLLQLVALAQLANLMAGLAIEAVGAGATVLLAQARAANATPLALLPLLNHCPAGVLRLRLGCWEKATVLVLTLDVFGQR